MTPVVLYLVLCHKRRGLPRGATIPNIDYLRLGQWAAKVFRWGSFPI